MEFKVETYAVLVAFLCNFFAIFLSNGIIVGVPSIANEFAMSNFIQNWIPTILFLVMAVFTVPAGQLSGKYGVKKSLLIGLIVRQQSFYRCHCFLSCKFFFLFHFLCHLICIFYHPFKHIAITILSLTYYR